MAALALLAVASPARANKCTGAKLRVAGKVAGSLARCDSKADGRGLPVDPACTGKATGALALGFTKADAKGTCAGTASDVQGMIDTFENNADRVIGNTGSPRTASKCDAKKVAALGKEAAGQLVCFAKAAAKDLPVDGACLLHNSAKFSAAIIKLASALDCSNATDAAALETVGDGVVADLKQAISICTTGFCAYGHFCDGPQCPNPICHQLDSPASLLMCRFAVVDPACGFGSCLGPSYCPTGSAPSCSTGPCLPASDPLSQVICGGTFTDGCGIGQCVGGSYCDNCLCYAPSSAVSQLFCAYCLPPPPGMVAWWPLDETSTSGTTAVDIVGSNDGTYQNGPVPMPGEVAGALSFDGVDDFVSAPRVIPTHDYRALTLDAWVLPSMLPAQDLWSILDYGDGEYSLLLEGSEIRFVDQPLPSSFAPLSSGAGITAGTWTHVAVVADPSAKQFRFYVNGAFVSAAGTGFYNPTGYYVGSGWTLGGDSLFGGSFPGRIDEVEVFERVLSPAEIQAIWAAGPAGKCKGCGVGVCVGDSYCDNCQCYASRSIISQLYCATTTTTTTSTTTTNTAPPTSTTSTMPPCSSPGDLGNACGTNGFFNGGSYGSTCVCQSDCSNQIPSSPHPVHCALETIGNASSYIPVFVCQTDADCAPDENPNTIAGSLPQFQWHCLQPLYSYPLVDQCSLQTPPIYGYCLPSCP